MDSIMKFALDGYKDIKADKLIGIFGNPIKHTLSPLIHDTLSKILGINERYIPFHIENNLCKYVEIAYDQGILGLNITIPYKQEVISCLAEVDAAAKLIGAVNTLVRCKEGYMGYNTDMPGLARAILSEGMKLKDKRIIILGAGGAARAAAYMCAEYGASRVFIVNRTFEKAYVIADDMNHVFDTDIYVPISSKEYRKIPFDNYMFIQCTSVGLHEGDGLPLIDDKKFYEMADCGVDLIYNPAETPFIKLLKNKGIRAINGLKMLLYQGIMAYELWNNLKISDDLADRVYKVLCREVYETIRYKSNNIVLIGYMGSGKTTVGEYIAKKFEYDFLDTDSYIVEREGMSINDIFKLKGEAYFRELETEILKEFQGKINNTVISTGGGLPVRIENRELLRKIGTIYYLCTSADSIYNRLKDCKDRPLLACENPHDRIKEMLDIRHPLYVETADFEILTDDKTIDDISESFVLEDRI